MSDDVGHVKRWWFIIHAPENVLLNLENLWEHLHLQTGWKLKPCFRPLQPVADSIASTCVTADSRVGNLSSPEESNDGTASLEHDMYFSVKQQSTASSHISPETCPLFGELRPG